MGALTAQVYAKRAAAGRLQAGKSPTQHLYARRPALQFEKLVGLQMAVQLQGVAYVCKRLCLFSHSRHPMHIATLRLVVSYRCLTSQLIDVKLAGSWRFLPRTVKNQ